MSDGRCHLYFLEYAYGGQVIDNQLIVQRGTERSLETCAVAQSDACDSSCMLLELNVRFVLTIMKQIDQAPHSDLFVLAACDDQLTRARYVNIIDRKLVGIENFS